MSDPTLTLLYEFAKRQTLAASRGLGPTLSIVRASDATYLDAQGILQTAASGDRQTLTTNTQTTPRNYVGPVRVSLTGTFGGGTFKMQAEDPSGVFVDVAGSDRTAADDFLIDFPDGAENKIQGDLSGATTPVLVVWNQGVDRGA